LSIKEEKRERPENLAPLTGTGNRWSTSGEMREKTQRVKEWRGEKGSGLFELTKERRFLREKNGLDFFTRSR
jgi:hypothetical protein